MTEAQLISLAVTAALALAALTWQVVSWRRSGPQVTAELGVGQVAEDGVLIVEFASGHRTVITLPPAAVTRGAVSARPVTADDVAPQTTPVNAVFVRNKGRTAVTVSRCHYTSSFFTIEPQPDASRWGDLLPKRLDPGADAILVHEYLPMRALLNRVMRDVAVDLGVFTVMLTLGNGQKVLAMTVMRVRADMDERDLAETDGMITRREILSSALFERQTIIGRWRPRRRQ